MKHDEVKLNPFFSLQIMLLTCSKVVSTFDQKSRLRGKPEPPLSLFSYSLPPGGKKLHTTDLIFNLTIHERTLWIDIRSSANNYERQSQATAQTNNMASDSCAQKAAVLFSEDAGCCLTHPSSDQARPCELQPDTSTDDFWTQR